MSKKADKYTMKIPKELKNLFQDYIDKNPGLGFKKVSQFALHILQQKAIEIKKELESD
jgi:recombinational DNA repair protein RecR